MTLALVLTGWAAITICPYAFVWGVLFVFMALEGARIQQERDRAFLLEAIRLSQPRRE